MFRKLKEVLEEVVEETELEGGIDKGSVITLWPEIVGEKIAAETCPYLFRTGTLFVATGSSVWAQELGLMRRSLVQKINKRVGKDIVKDIRFQARPPGNKRNSSVGQSQ